MSMVLCLPLSSLETLIFFVSAMAEQLVTWVFLWPDEEDSSYSMIACALFVGLD
jgi:hypothetical protein